MWRGGGRRLTLQRDLCSMSGGAELAAGARPVADANGHGGSPADQQPVWHVRALPVCFLWLRACSFPDVGCGGTCSTAHDRGLRWGRERFWHERPAPRGVSNQGKGAPEVRQVPKPWS
jgi:hypothetical protein